VQFDTQNCPKGKALKVISQGLVAWRFMMIAIVATGLKPRVVETFTFLRLSDKGVALTYIVATGFNPWATSPKHIKSAIGTMHIIWAEPTALFNIFSFTTG
jgi:hypothetical protein